jgi:uncharacterized protein (TIGR02300 family)
MRRGAIGRAPDGPKLSVLGLLTAGQRGAKSSAVFQTIFKDSQVAKPELGTKRLCGSCGAKFYDLSKDPIVCPKCETVFHPVVYTSTRSRPEAARAPVAPLGPEAAEVPEAADVELVSLEDADAESGGGKKAAAGDVDVEEDEVEVADEGAEDDTFLETEDDEGADVSDIVGGDREDEEDT